MAASWDFSRVGLWAAWWADERVEHWAVLSADSMASPPAVARESQWVAWLAEHWGNSKAGPRDTLWVELRAATKDGH